MIFVTVGTQLPFDRLVKAVDDWAYETKRDDVFAQAGDTTWRPRRLTLSTYMNPTEYVQRFSEAELVVSHAGMGTILTALRLRKRLIVMPRRAHLGEHRSDHQVATVEHLRKGLDLIVASDETELTDLLHKSEQLKTSGLIESSASPELIDTIRTFVNEEAIRQPGLAEPT